MRRALPALLLVLLVPPPVGADPGDEPVACAYSRFEKPVDLRGSYVAHLAEDCRWAVRYVRFHRVTDAYYYIQADEAPPNYSTAVAVLLMESTETTWPNETTAVRREATLRIPPAAAQIDYNEYTGTNGLTHCRVEVNATRPDGGTASYSRDRPPACWPDGVAFP